MTKAEEKTLCNLKERLRDLLEELDNLEYSGKRWKPKMGEKYYYIVDFGAVCADSWYGNDFHKKLYAAGNVFPSEEVAIFEAERRRVIAELSDYAEGKDAVWDGKHPHYYIVYNCESNHIEYDYAQIYKNTCLYFPTAGGLDSAIKAVGEDRVKKYYLRVKE